VPTDALTTLIDCLLLINSSGCWFGGWKRRLDYFLRGIKTRIDSLDHGLASLNEASDIIAVGSGWNLGP
jgi:hypothetical protein